MPDWERSVISEVINRGGDFSAVITALRMLPEEKKVDALTQKEAADIADKVLGNKPLITGLN